jgi:hypothetical protein
MKKVLLAVTAALLAGSANAAIIYSTVGSIYSENFDTLPNSGSSTTWTDNSTLAGWFLVNKDGNTPATIAINNGSSNAGSFYSYGTTDSTDRALGGLGSGGTYFGSPTAGNVAGYWGVKITNNTGEILTKFTVTYDVEQWRDQNTTEQPLISTWSINPSDWINGAWSSGAITNSPQNLNALTLDGNIPANRIVGVTFTAEDISWAQGQTLWIRFRELNDAGSDHALAVDNFQLSAIPEPGTLSILGLFGAALALRLRRRRG